MYVTSRLGRVSAAALMVVLGIALLIGGRSFVFAQATEDYPEACKQLFKLPSGTYMQDIDKRLLGNKEVCEAYQFLLQRNGSGSRGAQCFKTQADRILKLNPQFAVSLYKSLTEMEKQFGGKNIIQSGYRCDGTNGNHPRGCAVDIIYASCLRQHGGDTLKAWRCSSDHIDKATNTWSQPEQKWIDANGKNYGIQLRLRFAPEGHHVEPTSINGCLTSAPVTSGPTGSPTSNFTDSVRQIFGMQPAQPAYPTQPAIASQPLSTAQSPLSSFSGSIATPLVSDSLVTTETTATTSNSIADRLNELVNGPATTTQSATSVPLVINSNDVGGVVSTQPTQQTSGTASIGGGITQSTFSASQPTQVSPQTDSARYQSILTSLRTALETMLNYLRPFRRGTAHDETHESEYDFE